MSCSNSKAVNIVDELRSARNNISVYKTEVSGISSDIDKIVIVVEGKDDPGVYRVWLKQVLPDTIYKKIYITKAGDKKSVLSTLTTTLGSGRYKDNIYFIVDHDFNGNLGFYNKNLLVLNAYSIENYIFTKEMVWELLECNFHIENDSLKNSLAEKYHNDLLNFLPKISDLNFLIYYAVLYKEKPFQLKKEKQDFSKHLDFTTTKIDFKSGVDIISKLIQNVISERIQEILSFSDTRKNFNKLQPINLSYRGKFIEGFFDKWILMLIEDSKSQNPKFFPEKSSQVIRFNPSVQDLSFYAS
ncbi:DUF4435 domain-containing protein, partial [Acinetobacter baumannii]